jgi:DNA-directed RNA polymerase subunit RPC12/RpoP
VKTANPVTKRVRCPACQSEGGDTSSDNLVIYEDGGAHCYACGYHRFPDGEEPAGVKVNDDVVSKDWTPVKGKVVALPPS